MTTAALTAPELEQRLDALQRATKVRIDRAKLKKDLAAGRTRIADVLQDPPECVHTAKVNELLLALPKFGRVRVSKALARARVTGTTRLEDLSDTQRAALARAIYSQAPRDRQSCRSTSAEDTR
jgi:hypothetical protein